MRVNPICRVPSDMCHAADKQVQVFIDAGVDLNYLYGDKYKRTILDIVNGKITPFPQNEKYRARLEGSKKLIEEHGGKTSAELGAR